MFVYQYDYDDEEINAALSTQHDMASLSESASSTIRSPLVQKVASLHDRYGNQAVQRMLNEGSIRKSSLPTALKTGIESLSNLPMDDVTVHYNSIKPASVNALAFAQGTEIHLAPGQEKHLPHEAWHVVQQKQGRVQPTMQVKGITINDNSSLELEADKMGARAMEAAGEVAHFAPNNRVDKTKLISSSVLQLQKNLQKDDLVKVKVRGHEFLDDDAYDAVIISVEDGGNKYIVRFTDATIDSYIQEKEYEESLVYSVKGRARQDLPITASIAPWDKDRLKLSLDAKKSISDIVGEAAKIIDLSEDQLERLIALLLENDDGNFHLKNLITSLQFDLKDLKEHNETPLEIEERQRQIIGEIEGLERGAFQARFHEEPENADPVKLMGSIAAWWKEMKAAEGTLTFESAFKTNRMTARQINIGSTARGGQFKVQKLGSKPNEETDREMTLDNTVTGIVKRTKPQNFREKATVNQEGLHDLSASLLDGDQGIYEQLKKYEESVVLFMPLPEEKDLQIFSVLAKLKRMPPEVIKAMSGMLTRPIFAQASDMGTRYVDTESGSEGEGAFRYGVTGTVIRSKGDRARNINQADLAAREKGALAYKEIAKASITKVNEIVMAYRQHQSELFPMFAAWDENNKDFVVLKDDLTPTGMIITNDGKYGPA